MAVDGGGCRAPPQEPAAAPPGLRASGASGASGPPGAWPAPLRAPLPTQPAAAGPRCRPRGPEASGTRRVVEVSPLSHAMPGRGGARQARLRSAIHRPLAHSQLGGGWGAWPRRGQGPRLPFPGAPCRPRPSPAQPGVWPPLPPPSAPLTLAPTPRGATSVQQEGIRPARWPFQGHPSPQESRTRGGGPRRQTGELLAGRAEDGQAAGRARSLFPCPQDATPTHPPRLSLALWLCHTHTIHTHTHTHTHKRARGCACQRRRGWGGQRERERERERERGREREGERGREKKLGRLTETQRRKERWREEGIRPPDPERHSGPIGSQSLTQIRERPC